ncbi:ROK family protein [Oerskovia sp. M15]
MNLTGTSAHAVVTDLRGTVLSSAETPLSDRSPDAVVRAVVGLVDDLEDAGDPLTVIGISLGGHSVDRATVRNAPFLDWQDVPLGALVAAASGRFTIVGNDVAALTAAEHWFGEAQGLESFALLTVGTGSATGSSCTTGSWTTRTWASG